MRPTNYTQNIVGDGGGQGIYGAPSGLGPVGFDDPAMTPIGLRPAPQPRERGQYRQRVDESVYAVSGQVIPGWRGMARTFPHFPDPWAEPPIGPIREINAGYPFNYVPTRVRSYVPATSVINIIRGGKTIKSYRFRAQPIQELGASPAP